YVENQQDFTHVAMLLPTLSPPPTTAPVAGSAPEGTVDGVADLGLGEIHPGRLQQERPLAVRYLLHAAVESEHQAGGEVHHAAGVPGGHRRQVEDHGTPGAEVLAEALAVTEAAGALDDGLGHGHQSVLDELVLGGQGDGAARGGYGPSRGTRPGLGGVRSTGPRGGLVEAGAVAAGDTLVHGLRVHLDPPPARRGLVHVAVGGVSVVLAPVAGDRAEVGVVLEHPAGAADIV